MLPVVQVNLRLDDALLERVDEARGGVPRNAWIRGAVERALEAVDGVDHRGSPALAEEPRPAAFRYAPRRDVRPFQRS